MACPTCRAWQLSNEATESGQGEETNIFKKVRMLGLRLHLRLNAGQASACPCLCV